MAKIAPEPVNDTAEYKNFIELLGIYTAKTNELNALQIQADESLLGVLDDTKDDYAEHQETLTKTGEAIELCARRHPEWFGEKKSIATPYGTVKLTDSTVLEVGNAELSTVLIKAQAEKDAEFKADHYLRIKTELNLEALATLDDATLKRLRIERVTKSNFSVVPAKVKLGKGAAAKKAAEVTA
ncbi:MAG: host-nuclease inhibitor Gam family protein [Acidobacteriota bacterium]